MNVLVVESNSSVIIKFSSTLDNYAFIWYVIILL